MLGAKFHHPGQNATVSEAILRQSATPYLLAYGALLVASLAPMWLVSMPPLVDYPNHLARMHILIHAPDSPLLSQFYQVRLALIPNLAMDLLVPPLAHLMPLEAAGKAFVSLTLVLLSSGAIALHYALYRKFSPLPFAAFLLLYNRIFLYGFLNFLFGLGLALWALAAWIYLPARRAWPRAMLFYAITFVLFVAHLSALGVFALCVLAYEVRLHRDRNGTIRSARGAAWIAALALGPGLLVLFFSLGSADAAGAEPLFRFDEPGFMVARKLLAPLVLFGNYAPALDVATLGILLCGIVYAARRRRLSLDRRISGSLVLLAAAFLVMPFEIFGSAFADLRILVAVAFLLVASFDVRAGVKHQQALTLAVLAIFGVRMAVLADRWEQSESAYGEYVRAIEVVPEGSALLAVWTGKPNQTFEPPLAHLASLAVIRKSVFLPSMYAMPRGQPITFAPAYRAIAQQAPWIEQLPGANVAWEKALDQYDYILVVREDLFSRRPPAILRPVYEGTDFRLYRTPRGSLAVHKTGLPSTGVLAGWYRQPPRD